MPWKKETLGLIFPIIQGCSQHPTRGKRGKYAVIDPKKKPPKGGYGSPSGFFRKPVQILIIQVVTPKL